jgi:peptidoglycan/LPS O-acetylase OafA/YrhL
MSMLFITFLIIDSICILLSLLLLFTGRPRWRLVVLVPLAFAILSAIIAFIGHSTQFPAWRLVVVLIFAAAVTALICLLTARLLLRIGPQEPANSQ